MKKFLVMFLVLSSILLLSIGTYAASISVENPTIGKEYSGYQIFYASYDEENDLAAYFIDSDSFWFGPANDDASPFILEQVGDSTWHNVIIKSTFTDSQILSWFKGQDLPDEPDLYEQTALSNTLVWEDVDDGYYYVTSNLGSFITLLNCKGNVRIVDKNQYPGWEYPQEPDLEDPDLPERPSTLSEVGLGKNVSKEGCWYGKNAKAQIGDTVYFKVNAYAPKYSLDQRVYDYTFVNYFKDDEYLLNDDFSITLNGEELSAPQVTIDKETIYEGRYMTYVTITIHAYTEFDDYPAVGHLEINYSAILATHINPTRDNNATMSWTQFDPLNESIITEAPLRHPYGPEVQPGTLPEKIYMNVNTYGFTLAKIDQYGDPVTGAVFRLLDENGDDVKLIYTGNKAYGQHLYYISDDQTIEGDDIVIEDDDNRVLIFGIDHEKLYYIEEIEAPSGYNILIEPVDFYFDVLPTFEGGLYDEIIYIENRAGEALPETGSLGTKILLLAGAIIMLAAVVIYVVKKDMDLKYSA